jgi:tetratricopeptide (TPR) repeat protein
VIARFLFAVLLLAAPHARAQEPLRLDATFVVDGPLANLRLTPSREFEARIETRGREAILRFETPLAAFDGAPMVGQMPRFLANIAAGFDSVLIQATPETIVVARREGASILIVLRLNETPGAAAEADPIVLERAERRLERLRAATDEQAGRFGIARGRLAELVARDPRDSDAIAQWGSLERRIGRTRRAAALYDRALEIDPNAPELRTARAELARETAGFARLEPEFRRTNRGEKRYTAGLAAEMPANEAWRALARFDTVRLDNPSVRRVQGYNAPFKGARNRLDLGLAHLAEDGDRTEARLFANERNLGAGLSRSFVGDFHRASFGAEIGRPYWDQAEFLVQDGTRDRAFAQYELPAFFGLAWRARTGLNRYNLPGAADVARAASFDGDVRWALDAWARGFAVLYSVDGEYPWKIATRDDPSSPGEVFRPSGLRYREIHALQAQYAIDLARDLDWGMPLAFDASAGPGYDRYGRRGGPLLGAGLTWTGESSLLAGLRAGYGRGVGRDSGDYLSIGGHIGWRM